MDRDIVWVHVCPPASHVRNCSSTDVPAHRSSRYYRNQDSITDSRETARDVISQIHGFYPGGCRPPVHSFLPFPFFLISTSGRPLSTSFPPCCPGIQPSTLDRTPSDGSFRPVKPFPYTVNLDLRIAMFDILGSLNASQTPLVEPQPNSPPPCLKRRHSLLVTPGA